MKIINKPLSFVRTITFIIALSLINTIYPLRANIKNRAGGRSNLSLLPLPQVCQSTSHSCGASSLQSVLNYWGISKREDELMKLCNTSTDGTFPYDIVEVAQKLGLNAELRQNLTVKDLEMSVSKGIPVIVLVQAYKDDKGLSWADDWDDGHYMVIIGVDQRNVYLEDPELLGSRGFIPRDEFEGRWHSRERSHDGKLKEKFIRTGIFIRGKKPKYPRPFVRIC
ncbi:cysteine peptidase family C39 domain-containing protein [Methanooceanicella nereidis]|nr:cysteine peptidase family C39 domain-containing protein [Methanocella sp. CWC-04]